MPTVLGVDASLTASGLSRIRVPDLGSDPNFVFTPDELLVTTIKPPGPKTKTLPEYARRIEWAVDRIDAAMEGVDAIAMEELAYGAKGATAWVLSVVWGNVIRCAANRGIPLGVVGTGQLKKYATGSGTSDKDVVLAAMVRRFPEVAITNNNESDALVLGLVACRELGYPIDHPTVAKAEVMLALHKKGPFLNV